MATKKKEKSLMDMTPFIETIYNRTIEWGEKYNLRPKGEKAPKEKYSEKAKELAKAIDEHSWGGHDPNVRKCFEIVLGESLPDPKGKSTKEVVYKHGTVLFILSDPTGSGLPVGEPVLVSTAEGNVKTKDNINYLLTRGTAAISSFRLPTINEVEDILTTLIESKDAALELSLLFLSKAGL